MRAADDSEAAGTHHFLTVGANSLTSEQQAEVVEKPAGLVRQAARVSSA